MAHNSYVAIKKALSLLYLIAILIYLTVFDNFDEPLFDQINKNTIENKDETFRIIDYIELNDINEEELKLNIPILLERNEQLISVIFNSFDHNIHYSVICKITDSFAKIESLLYEKYPEYRKYQKIFISNGKRVFRFGNLEMNIDFLL